MTPAEQLRDLLARGDAETRQQIREQLRAAIDAAARDRIPADNLGRRLRDPPRLRSRDGDAE